MSHEQEAPVERFNPRQLEELVKFEHITNQIAVWEDKTGGGYQYTYTWQTEKGNKKSETVFDLNEQLIGILNRAAFYMYLSFIEESEDMQQAADLIVRENEEMKAFGEQEELKQMGDIWENSI